MIDVVVIGLGIIGAAAARELSRYRLRILCLDAANDFAKGATGANSGIVHAGYDAKPGTLKARFNVEGNRMYDQWSRELEFSFRRNGSFVVYHRPEDKPAVEALFERGLCNGVKGMEMLNSLQAGALEPNLAGRVAGALYLTSGGITSPYEFCIACAENAAHNGAVIELEQKVEGIERIPGGYAVKTAARTIQTKTVVNAAGLYADEINNMICGKKLQIRPRRGEYLLMDDAMGAAFGRTIFNLPNEMGKGVLISPTVDGNLLLGPTTEETCDKEDTATTRAGAEAILAQSQKNWNVPKNRFITQFCGLRAHLSEGDDFIVGETEDGFFNAAGIESPGLTSAPAIGVHLAACIAQKLNAAPNESFDPIRPRIRRFREMSETERKEAIRRNPLYAHMICRCEQVTEAEIVEAVRRGAVTLNGVKRRTRAGMGKCQRGFCGPDILSIIARERGLEKTEVLLDGAETNILTGRIR